MYPKLSPTAKVLPFKIRIAIIELIKNILIYFYHLKKIFAKKRCCIRNAKCLDCFSFLKNLLN